jgi:hypothetical protein
MDAKKVLYYWALNSVFLKLNLSYPYFPKLAFLKPFLPYRGPVSLLVTQVQPEIWASPLKTNQVQWTISLNSILSSVMSFHFYCHCLRVDHNSTLIIEKKKSNPMSPHIPIFSFSNTFSTLKSRVIFISEILIKPLIKVLQWSPNTLRTKYKSLK